MQGPYNLLMIEIVHTFLIYYENVKNNHNCLIYVQYRGTWLFKFLYIIAMFFKNFECDAQESCREIGLLCITLSVFKNVYFILSLLQY